MSNLANGARRAQQHADRLHWLKANRDLYLRLPGAKQDVERDHAAALDEAVKQMKFYRLYHPSSAPESVRWGIRILVSELRGELVPRGIGPNGRRA